VQVVHLAERTGRSDEHLGGGELGLVIDEGSLGGDSIGPCAK